MSCNITLEHLTWTSDVTMAKGQYMAYNTRAYEKDGGAMSSTPQ